MTLNEAQYIYSSEKHKIGHIDISELETNPSGSICIDGWLDLKFLEALLIVCKEVARR